MDIVELDDIPFESKTRIVLQTNKIHTHQILGTNRLHYKSSRKVHTYTATNGLYCKPSGLVHNKVVTNKLLQTIKNCKLVETNENPTLLKLKLNINSICQGQIQDFRLEGAQLKFRRVQRGKNFF